MFHRRPNRQPKGVRKIRKALRIRIIPLIQAFMLRSAIIRAR